MTLSPTLAKYGKSGLVLVAAVTLIVWVYGCQPKVPSLIDGRRPVTRAELQLELTTLQKRFEIRSATLEQKEAIRRLIAENVLLMAQSGQINPLGILTGIAALYGVGSAGTTAARKIKEARNAKTLPTTPA